MITSVKSQQLQQSLKPIKFWQFGCWNNLNTKKNETLGCLNKVITLINNRSIPEENKPDFLIVSGDNYYPDKIKPKDGMDPTIKKKIIFSEKLKEGINSLPEKIKINMILGNHDLETNNEDNLYIESLETPEKNDCQIIQLELELLNKKENVDYFFFKSQVLNNETLLLMIDTSIYDEDAAIYLPCYNKFFTYNVFYQNEELSFDSIAKLRSFQLNRIMKAIKKNIYITNLIIVGHHPIYQVKYKKKETEPIKYTSEIYINFRPVLENIYEILKNNTTYYYLCSDLHLYQKGKIQIIMKKSETKEEEQIMNIQQYIVGTGGTELDDALAKPIDTEKLYTNNNVNYTLQEERDECGFLECIISNSSIPTFQFISIVMISSLGGKKYKTRRKTKKFKSKAKTRTKKSKIKKSKSKSKY
jgi:hypothetical protein